MSTQNGHPQMCECDDCRADERNALAYARNHQDNWEENENKNRRVKQHEEVSYPRLPVDSRSARYFSRLAERDTLPLLVLISQPRSTRWT